MSVVIVTPDNFKTVRKTVRHLRAQNVCEKMEIVIVAPSAESLGLEDEALDGFLRHQVVEVGPVTSTARARAAGVRAARAGVVALVEDHAYPAPGWAEALINRHRGSWEAVGPVVSNANPRSVTSWVNLLVEYGPWLEPAEGGEREHLPGHNSSYKREVLTAYGDRLEAMLEAESVLHWDLRSRGHKLYLEPKARVFHRNFSVAAPSLTLRFHGGRLFAASRAREWPAWRRAFFAAASPLIPVVRCARIAREMYARARTRRMMPLLLPALLVGLAFDGAGEAAGYALGPGGAMAKLSDMEFHRDRFVAESDRREESVE